MGFLIPAFPLVVVAVECDGVTEVVVAVMTEETSRESCSRSPRAFFFFRLDSPSEGGEGVASLTSYGVVLVVVGEDPLPLSVVSLPTEVGFLFRSPGGEEEVIRGDVRKAGEVGFFFFFASSFFSVGVERGVGTTRWEVVVIVLGEGVAASIEEGRPALGVVSITAGEVA